MIDIMPNSMEELNRSGMMASVAHAPSKAKRSASNSPRLPANFLAALLMASVKLQDAINENIIATAGTTMEVLKSAFRSMVVGQKYLDDLIEKINHAEGEELSKLVQRYQNLAQKVGNVQNAQNTNASSMQTATANLAQNQKQVIDFSSTAKEINAALSQLLASRM